MLTAEVIVPLKIQKPALELYPTLALLEQARVLGHSEKSGRYGSQDWLTNETRSHTRELGAALRHINAHLAGVDRDHDSGLYHLAHAGCRVAIALEMLIREIGLDDRHKPTREQIEKIQLYLRANLMQP